MNDGMWDSEVTQDNLAALELRGVRIVAPGYGDLACGTTGLGRMAEPHEILEATLSLRH
jgi:phosphopantothenoylcysteine decarboxylase/phosphopantothenate--cysteine ligase